MLQKYIQLLSVLSGFIPSAVLLYAVGTVGYGNTLVPGHAEAIIYGCIAGCVLFIPVVVAAIRKIVRWQTLLLPILGAIIAYAMMWIRAF